MEKKDDFGKLLDFFGKPRRCNYCRKDTPTVEEDCAICGWSKPYPDFEPDSGGYEITDNGLEIDEE